MRRRRAAANGSARDSRGSPRQPIAAALSRPEHPGGPRPRRRRAPPPPETPRVSVIPRLSPGYPTGNAAGPGYPPGTPLVRPRFSPGSWSRLSHRECCGCRSRSQLSPPLIPRVPVIPPPGYPAGPREPPGTPPWEGGGSRWVPGVIRSFSFGL